jgi:cystathionine beta-lyase/cystathionine gamma-synthase
LTAFDTRAVHAGHDPAQHNGSVTTPVYQVSTFVRPYARPVESGWDYSRIANPTRAALEVGQVCERTRVFTLAVSLGSVESLIEHPARMTHCTTAGTPVGVSDSLLRLSIGLEDGDELIADLAQALAD